MAKRLTLKQREFVANYIKLKNGTKAALKAYETNDYETANAISVENLQKPSIQEAIETAMVKLNLTPERALKPIDDALDDDDVKTRLMGTDRWLKLQPKQTSSGNTINNFGTMIAEMKDKYSE